MVSHFKKVQTTFRCHKLREASEAAKLLLEKKLYVTPRHIRNQLLYFSRISSTRGESYLRLTNILDKGRGGAYELETAQPKATASIDIIGYLTLFILGFVNMHAVFQPMILHIFATLL